MPSLLRFRSIFPSRCAAVEDELAIARDVKENMALVSLVACQLPIRGISFAQSIIS